VGESDGEEKGKWVTLFGERRVGGSQCVCVSG